MTWSTTFREGLLVCLAPLPPAALVGIDNVRIPLPSGATVVAFRHDEPTVAKLREVGFMPPAPPLDYDFPGRYRPRENQRATTAAIVEYPRLFVLNGLRTGKTLAAMWGMDYLMRKGVVRRALIVAPKTILIDVWSKEFLLSMPRTPYAVLEGSRARKQQIANDTRIKVLIVNPESVILLGPVPELDMIVVDEATCLKNAHAQRAKALLALSQGKRLVLMTGTPAPQTPTDAHGMIKVQRGGQYVSFRHFRDMTMVQLNMFKWAPRPQAAETVAREMRPCVRYRAEDCYDVPEEQVIDVAIPLSPEQARLVKQFEQEAFAELQGAGITATNAAAALSKALQVMSGGVYGDETDEGKPAYAVECQPLWDSMADLLEQIEGPALIFTSFRISAAIIADKLKAAGRKVGLVTAGTTSQQRSEIFQGIQSGALDTLVAIPRTVAHGLDLSASNSIIWVSPPMSFETYEQANARISGSNQKRKRQIYRLIPDRVTRELFKRQDTRRSLQDTILSLAEKGEA